MSQLVISKSLSKSEEDYTAKQAHVTLAEKMRKRDVCKDFFFFSFFEKNYFTNRFSKIYVATAPVLGDRYFSFLFFLFLFFFCFSIFS